MLETIVVSFGILIAIVVLWMVWPLVAFVALGMLTGVDELVFFALVLGLIAEFFWIKAWK